MTRLSIILCFFEMEREAPRTMLSTQLPYQLDVDWNDYEVIAVDVGDSHGRVLESFASSRPGCKVLSVPTPVASPVSLINRAVRDLATGENVLIAIDGARIFSCGLVSASIATLQCHPSAFVFSLACHLGSQVQMTSRLQGYNQLVEDAMIAESGWPDHADALYGCSTFAGSSIRGIFKSISESNSFAMSRSEYLNCGGLDERFLAPGGGLANLEFFARQVLRSGGLNICLATETTFHQIHGGAATSETIPQSVFHDEYFEIFGAKYQSPDYKFLIWPDRLRPAARRLIEASLGALG